MMPTSPGGAGCKQVPSTGRHEAVPTHRRPCCKAQSAKWSGGRPPGCQPRCRQMRAPGAPAAPLEFSKPHLRPPTRTTATTNPSPHREPFKKPRGWLMWGLLGIALSPLVVYCSAMLSEAVGASDAGGRGTVDAGACLLPASDSVPRGGTLRRSADPPACLGSA